jgi:two-component system, NarL family, sensor histidine kinase DevS
MTGPGLTDPALLQRLLDICRSVVSEHDVDAVLRRVVDEACEITEAKYGALGVMNERGDGLDRFITTGIDEEAHAAIGELPRGRGVLGVLISDARPLRLANVGAHPRSYGFPPAHPPMNTFLGVPIRIRGEAYGNLYLTEKGGGREFDEVDEEAVRVLADIAGIAIDNARLYQRVESRRDELERAVVGLEATTEIARAVGGETDLDRVLELIAKRGRALVNARAVVILLEDRGQLTVVTAAGEIDDAVIGRRLPVADSIYGQVLQSRRPERIGDLPSRLRTVRHAIGVEASAALAVPLVFKGRALGVLVAYDHEQGPSTFMMSEQQLLTSFATSAAIAVGTAKTVAQEHLRHSMQAAELERRRWARELHDETLQGLGALNVLLSAGLEGDLESSARKALGFIEEQIASLRSLISDLRPAVLDDLGLQPALEALAERVASTASLTVELDVDLGSESAKARPRLIPEIEDAIYRLVQEALNNVSKHANTNRADVSVRESGGSVAVEVRDHGIGFELDGVTGGFGLIGMRERAELVEGKLAVASAPGEGTTVSVVVPAKHIGDDAPPVRESLGSDSQR